MFVLIPTSDIAAPLIALPLKRHSTTDRPILSLSSGDALATNDAEELDGPPTPLRLDFPSWISLQGEQVHPRQDSPAKPPKRQLYYRVLSEKLRDEAQPAHHNSSSASRLFESNSIETMPTADNTFSSDQLTASLCSQSGSSLFETSADSSLITSRPPPLTSHSHSRGSGQRSPSLEYRINVKSHLSAKTNGLTPHLSPVIGSPAVLETRPAKAKRARVRFEMDARTGAGAGEASTVFARHISVSSKVGMAGMGLEPALASTYERMMGGNGGTFTSKMKRGSRKLLVYADSTSKGAKRIIQLPPRRERTAPTHPIQLLSPTNTAWNHPRPSLYSSSLRGPPT